MFCKLMMLVPFCCMFGLHSASAVADEGMWLFNDLPHARLQADYGFEPTDEWAQHVMLSSVRLNVGGSGSFVSSNGLLMTNHHVASDTLYKLSTPEQDIAEDGYLADSQHPELKAPDLELNLLVSIHDVTDQVTGAVAGKAADEAAKARLAVMSEIEKASLKETGLRSDVVTLFGGAKYHLYRYRKYTDVRLVWAPEAKIAFFGGDADNFEYPRYCLDVTLFRVYENDQPAKIEHFLKWAPQPVDEGDLVFVSGNPGRTQRQFTVSALKYLRDVRNPYVLDFLRRKEVLMQQFALGGKEHQRRAQDDLFGIQNSRKAYGGMLSGLQNPAVMAQKQQAEEALLAQIRDNPRIRPLAEAWQQIQELQTEKESLQGTVYTFRSRLYDIAQTLVLIAAEDQKPSSKRLREFRDSARESLEQDLFSTAPIYSDLERVKLADEISRLVEKRGGDDKLVARILAGKSPAERAAELISRTQLVDPETRRTLAEGGPSAVESSSDPLIQLALLMQPEFRAYRESNQQIEERERQAYAKISEATIAVQGTDTYPDATFTLRLAYGAVRGYQEKGEQIPAWTTMGGTFEHAARHESQDDWQLPESWLNAKSNLDASTPFNFVCTADIIGGNSGSPVINRNAEFVGIIFDGNIQSLTSDYLYTDEFARAVSVSGAAIKEALNVVYNAKHIADQLGR